MFIGRERELETLELYYRSGTVRTCAVYGRRRVGKTRLLEEFCVGKPHIWFNLSGNDPERILDHVARDIAAYTGRDEAEVRRTIRSLDDLTDFLATLGSDGRVVIVLDEFPDAVAAMSDVPSTMMRYIDGPLSHQDAFLIVCGSSISAMRRDLNDGQGPLYGRFPIQLRLGPLPYEEARAFHPDASEEDTVRYYAIASGIPLYHNLMAVHGSPEQAVKRLFLSEVGALCNEARSILGLELSPMRTYDRALGILANGPIEIRELADRMGISQTRCREMMENLESMDMVSCRTPYGNAKRGRRYMISDGLVMFSYAVAQERDALVGMDTDRMYDALRGRIETFYGRRFEEVCRSHILRTEGCTWCGTWWGNVPRRDGSGAMIRDQSGRVVTEPMEVDIVARVGGRTTMVLMCECKFTNWRCGVQELADLERAAGQARQGGESIMYVLFSRGGFTPDLREIAHNRDDVALVSLEDLFRRRVSDGRRIGGGDGSDADPGDDVQPSFQNPVK